MSDYKNFLHLVDLYTHCRMMHGAYKVKMKFECFNIKVIFYNIVYSAGVVMCNYQLINGYD